MQNEIRPTYIEKIRPYIEDMKERDFTNTNFPCFLKYLNKSEIESLEYQLQKAGYLNTQQFDLLLTSLKLVKSGWKSALRRFNSIRNKNNRSRNKLINWRRVGNGSKN